MFSKDPFAQTEYAFIARSNKINAQSGLPMLPSRWIKVKFGSDVWIGKAYWFDVENSAGWQYASGWEDTARYAISVAEFRRLTIGECAVKECIKELTYIFDALDEIDTEERYNEIRYERKDKLRRMR